MTIKDLQNTLQQHTGIILDAIKKRTIQTTQPAFNQMSSLISQVPSQLEGGLNTINTALDKTPILGNIRSFFEEQDKQAKLQEYNKQLAQGATQSQTQSAMQRFQRLQDMKKVMSMAMGATGTLENVGGDMLLESAEEIAQSEEYLKNFKEVQQADEAFIQSLKNRIKPSQELPVGEIEEQGSGWLPGLKVQVDRAILNKDYATLESLMSKIPEVYKSRFWEIFKNL